jgi:hypothetical protein
MHANVHIPASALMSNPPPGAPPAELPLLELEVTPLDFVEDLAFSCAFFSESAVVALSGSSSTAYCKRT